jgi:hypothetical protein
MRIKPFKGNVLISNLPSEISSAELATLFDDFGLVLGAKVDKWHDRPGGVKGEIDLAPETSVDKAIAALNGQLVGTNKITVRKAPKPVKKAAAPKAPPPRPVAHVYEVPPEYAAPVSSRKVVVEYRTPRRVVLPPRVGAGAPR